MGLPVDGKAVVGPTNLDWQDLYEHLLGNRPPSSVFHFGRSSLKWFHKRFSQILEDHYSICGHGIDSLALLLGFVVVTKVDSVKQSSNNTFHCFHHLGLGEVIIEG
ncbi:serine/threonine-protein phosphatase 7 long form-like protein [Senna tora]|uniref:Serine/threonine-protein phosphatase 7 long form-like protein n=1 Tax=Senna tora TaxID=362788 RepID=A0A834TGL9_9FABA|nr:serine/threonine-protein phosphatase 7 long form-like protein [Senna tora]